MSAVETGGAVEKGGAVEIVRVGAAAARLLARLHATSFPEPWTAGAIAELLAMPGAFALLAQGGDGEAGPPPAPLGFTLCRAAAGECELLTLAVLPEARRRGVGRALLDTACTHARAYGGEAVFLEVAEDNHAARRLYAGQGFEVVGRRAHYYRVPGGGAGAALQLRLQL